MDMHVCENTAEISRSLTDSPELSVDRLILFWHTCTVHNQTTYTGSVTGLEHFIRTVSQGPLESLYAGLGFGDVGIGGRPLRNDDLKLLISARPEVPKDALMPTPFSTISIATGTLAIGCEPATTGGT